MRIVSALAAIAFVAVLLQLRGPGITIDESLNVRPGVVILRAEQTYGLLALDPRSQRDIFTAGILPTDYPPLGRVWLGLGHELARFVAGSDRLDATGIDVTLARTASAAAFALTILLVGRFGRRFAGEVGGVAAAIAVALSPRLFGHAHLASVETVLDLSFAGCVLVAAERLAEKPSDRIAALVGFLWGLVLLTKIQAVLVPIPLAGWMLWHHRVAAIRPLAIVAAVGLLTFLVGWPWLWDAPIAKTLAYFGQGTDRITLFAWYFGEAIPDRAVPWHYPLVQFALTQPPLFLTIGCYGLWQGRTSRPLRLVAATWAFVLLFFAVPGIVVYDGPRLMLVAYPLWAILVGAGASALWARWATHDRLRKAIAAVAVLMPLGHLIALSPCWLSYYAIGTGPAAAIGMERTYWGDSLTPDLLAEVADAAGPGGVILVAPSLHPAQHTEQDHHVPGGVTTQPYDPNSDARTLLVFTRLGLDPLRDGEPDPVVAIIRRLIGASEGDTVDGWTVRRVLRREGATLAVLAVRE